MWDLFARGARIFVGILVLKTFFDRPPSFQIENLYSGLFRVMSMELKLSLISVFIPEGIYSKSSDHDDVSSKLGILMYSYHEKFLYQTEICTSHIQIKNILISKYFLSRSIISVYMKSKLRSTLSSRIMK